MSAAALIENDFNYQFMGDAILRNKLRLVTKDQKFKEFVCFHLFTYSFINSQNNEWISII